MNQAVELKKGIYRIGVNDRRTHLFENYWPLPKGVAYNSYVIVDEKVVVVDTVERSRMDDYLESLETTLNGKKVDYLIVNHMEPDHSGAIKALLCHYPDMTIVGNCKTFPMLENFYGIHHNLLEVKEGSTLDLGSRKLQFYMAPMLHWPETMVTYLPSEHILFSGDIFGAFGTLDGGIFDDQLDLDYLEEEISRYLRALLHKEAFDHAGLIYGMGHAVYSLSDPRARIFRSFVEKLSAEKGYEKEFALYDAVSRLAPKIIADERQIYKGVSPNVDFYSGFAYSMLGLPVELYTPIFAIARIAGWSAHRLEEVAINGKIMRPAYKNIGEHKEYIPMEKR